MPFLRIRPVRAAPAGWRLIGTCDRLAGGQLGGGLGDAGTRRKTLVARPWLPHNPWHGRAAGTAAQRTLEDGSLGPPRGVRRVAVAIAGLIVMLSGSTPWVLAVGVIAWLAVAAVTLTGVFWARHELPEPRPGYWSMRFMLIHDTIHALSSAQRS